jgi:hypothetical protein
LEHREALEQVVRERLTRLEGEGAVVAAEEQTKTAEMAGRLKMMSEPGDAGGADRGFFGNLQARTSALIESFRSSLRQLRNRIKEPVEETIIVEGAWEEDMVEAIEILFVKVNARMGEIDKNAHTNRTRILLSLENAKQARKNFDAVKDEDLERKKQARTALQKAEADLLPSRCALELIQARLEERDLCHTGSRQELFQRLSQGERHPRWDALVAQERLWTVQQHPGEAIPTRVDVLSKFLPAEVQPLYRFLDTQGETRLCSLVQNGFYKEAKRGLEQFAASLSSIDREHLPEFIQALQATDQKGREQQRHMEYTRQLMYDEIFKALESSRDPKDMERKARLLERQQTEKILREGQVKEVRSFLFRLVRLDKTTGEQVVQEVEAGGVTKPMLATVELEVDGEMEKREVVVKLGFSELFLRPGITPGSGPMREVLGAMHSMAFGTDNVPPVVIRELDDYGIVSLHALLPGVTTISDIEPGHVFKSDTKEGMKEIESAAQMTAAEDVVMGRSDGHTDNNLVGRDGSLHRIDFGLEFSSEAEEVKFRSHWADTTQDQQIEPAVVTQLRAFANSSLRQLFYQALDMLPEDGMEAYKVFHNTRLTRLLSRETFPDPQKRWWTEGAMEENKGVAAAK